MNWVFALVKLDRDYWIEEVRQSAVTRAERRKKDELQWFEAAECEGLAEVARLGVSRSCGSQSVAVAVLTMTDLPRLQLVQAEKARQPVVWALGSEERVLLRYFAVAVAWMASHPTHRHQSLH